MSTHDTPAIVAHRLVRTFGAGLILASFAREKPDRGGAGGDVA
jgi:hypothetical protein